MGELLAWRASDQYAESWERSTAAVATCRYLNRHGRNPPPAPPPLLRSSRPRASLPLLFSFSCTSTNTIYGLYVSILQMSNRNTYDRKWPVEIRYRQSHYQCDGVSFCAGRRTKERTAESSSLCCWHTSIDCNGQIESARDLLSFAAPVSRAPRATLCFRHFRHLKNCQLRSEVY